MRQPGLALLAFLGPEPSPYAVLAVRKQCPCAVPLAAQDGTVKAWDPRRPSSAVCSLAVGAPAFSLALPPQQPHLVLVGDQLGRLSALDIRAASGGSTGEGGKAGSGRKPLAQAKVASDVVRCLACCGGTAASAAGAGELDVAAGGDDGRVALLSSKEAAAGELATLKVGSGWVGEAFWRLVSGGQAVLAAAARSI